MAIISKKNAVEIEKFGKLDEIIEFLIDCRRNGKSVLVVFNGKKLYSADITDNLNADKVYIIACGLTQAEHEAEVIDNNSCFPKFTGKESSSDMQKAMEEGEKKLEEVQQKYAPLRQKHIEEQKKSASHDPRSFASFESALKFLIECRNNGESVSIDFDGVTLYSADVGHDTSEGRAQEEIKAKFQKQIERQKAEKSIAQKREEKSELENEIGFIGKAIARVKATLAKITSRSQDNPAKDASNNHEDIE